MGKKKGKVHRARRRIAQKGFFIPSPTEVEWAMTPPGGWSAIQLAEWGVPWPPPLGWRHYLKAIYHQHNSMTHDTVFTEVFADRWRRITSNQTIWLTNVRRGGH